MTDLGSLTLESFSGLVGEPFRLGGSTAAEAQLEVHLIEAESLGSAPMPTMRAPFSILFSGPADRIVPQGTYRIEHERLGAIEVFLVPLQPEPDGARYQAIFS